MPTSFPRPRHRVVTPNYSYRRPLSLGELLPAIGVGIGAGLFGFYIARLLLQRTPLRVDHPHGLDRGTDRVALPPRAPERPSRP